jgi:hypothetical protein
MSKYPISFWSNISMHQLVPDAPGMWRDLGITLAMSPSYSAGDKGEVIKLLNRSAELDIKVIMRDYRTHWRNLTKLGEKGYRELFQQVLDDYGSNAAVYGFFAGDEPDTTSAPDAFAALRIQGEMAPQLTAYLNLLPWFSWLAPRFGTSNLSDYLDRVVSEGNAKLLSYDCYAQMQSEFDGLDVYFENLKGYYLATKRLGVPFFNIALSCGHYRYRCPTKDDLQWQLGTSVAHGAAGVSWYVIQTPGINDNYRNAPINQLGERTQAFTDMSEVNRVFNNYCGEIITELKIDTCYHVGKAYGGMPLFEPFGNVLEVESNDDVPLIFSRFHDKAGKTYYIVCCNSPVETTYVSITMKTGLNLMRCNYGNRFSSIGAHTDPIGEKDVQEGQTAGIWLSPGQIALLKED